VTQINQDAPPASILDPVKAATGDASPTEPTTAPAPAGSRDRSFARSVAWTAGAKWGGQLLTSGITLLVARILVPADYGLVGMAALFLGLVRFLSEFGIGSSVVVMRESNRETLASLNTCAAILGSIGMLVTMAFAIPLGHFFAAPDLPAVIMVSSLGFPIAAIRTLPAAVLQRDFRFKLLAAIDLGQAVSAALITLGLALAGGKYWSIILGNAAAALLASLAVIAFSPQRFGRPQLSKLRPAISLSKNITTATLGWYIYSNADFLVVGKMLGQAALGLYNIGWTLAMLIVERVTTLVSGVAPAYLAAAKHDLTELRRYLFRISGTIALLTFPASLGLALVADDFCRVILGARWMGAIGALRILAIYAGVRSLGPLLAQMLTVSGEDRFVARNGAAAAIVMPVAFVVGARWGVEGVAVAWVIAYPLVTTPLFMKTMRHLEIRVGDYLAALKPAFVSTAVMVVAVLALRFGMVNARPVVRLPLAIVVGAAAYGAALFALFRSRVQTLIRVLRQSAA
jgi:teichuronic acid exporter